MSAICCHLPVKVAHVTLKFDEQFLNKRTVMTACNKLWCQLVSLCMQVVLNIFKVRRQYEPLRPLKTFNSFTFVTMWLRFAITGWTLSDRSCGLLRGLRLRPALIIHILVRLWLCVRTGSLEAKLLLFTVIQSYLFATLLPAPMLCSSDGLLVCTAA